MAATYESNEAKIDALIDELSTKSGVPVNYRKLFDVDVTSDTSMPLQGNSFMVFDIYRGDEIVHTDIFPTSLWTDYSPVPTIPVAYENVVFSVNFVNSTLSITLNSDYSARIRGYIYEPNSNA